VDGAMRSSAAHNVATSYRAAGDFDLALQWYEEAVRLGAATSQSRVDALRAGDAAMEQIGEDLLTDV
jgi:predicted nucleotidyltransferase